MDVVQTVNNPVVIERVVQSVTVVEVGSAANVTVLQNALGVVSEHTRTVEVVDKGPKGDTGQPGTNGGIAPIHFAYGDAASIVFTAPANGVFTVCRVDITTPFNGVGAAVHVGVIGNIDALIPDTAIGPTQVAGYEMAADYPVTAGTGVGLQIVPGAGASQGAGVLFLSFVSSE